MLAIVEKKHLHLNNNNHMDFKNARKQFYASPRCETMTVELSGLLSGTVFPDGEHSTQPHDGYYDNKGEHDVGGVVIGDDNVAPSKYDSLWEEE